MNLLILFILLLELSWKVIWKFWENLWCCTAPYVTHGWCQGVHMWHKYLHISPINTLLVIWVCGIYMTFERHTCGWSIFCSLVVKINIEVYWFLMKLCSNVRSIIFVQCGSDVCLGAYARNVDCMHTHAPGDIVLSSEIIYICVCECMCVCELTLLSYICTQVNWHVWHICSIWGEYLLLGNTWI